MANEKRLIDANELLLDNEKYFCEPCKEKGHDYHGVACRACWVDDMRIAIEDAPTVDAVEVVRCKDCWKSAEGLCSYQLKNVPGKDFCGDGERKDNEVD